LADVALERIRAVVELGATVKGLNLAEETRLYGRSKEVAEFIERHDGHAGEKTTRI